MALWIGLATPALAGAWLQPEGHGLGIMQAAYFTGNEFFDRQGELQPQSRFTKYEIQPYGEYGLTDTITIGGTAFLHHVEQGGSDNFGLGDPEIFLRTRLWDDGKNIVSLQPLIKLPSFYDKATAPRGGSRSIDGELSLLYGRNLPILSDTDYIDTRIGYRWRSRGLSPQWRADAAFGTNIGEHWQVIPAIRAVYASDIDTGAFSEDGEQDYRLLKTDITTIYRLDEQRWLQLTLANHLLGENAGAGYGIALGYAEKF